MLEFSIEPNINGYSRPMPRAQLAIKQLTEHHIGSQVSLKKYLITERSP